MKMRIYNLSSILQGNILQVSEYTKGYEWETKQWKNLVQDIDTIINKRISSHYTGTIIIYQPILQRFQKYGINKLELVDIIDGQQRLITCSLYLSIILKELIKIGQKTYEAEIPFFLYSDNKSKLRPHQDIGDLYFDLVSKGFSNIKLYTIQQKRMSEAYNYLNMHLQEQVLLREEQGENYLRDLFDVIIRNLSFSLYIIEEESEIKRTLELMNSRGREKS
jgi:uncharacterized protein with ParB-like and HNH nuclease domain